MEKETVVEIARLEKMIARRWELVAKSYDLDIQRANKAVIEELEAELNKLSK